MDSCQRDVQPHPAMVESLKDVPEDLKVQRLETAPLVDEMMPVDDTLWWLVAVLGTAGFLGVAWAIARYTGSEQPLIEIGMAGGGGIECVDGKGCRPKGGGSFKATGSSWMSRARAWFGPLMLGVVLPFAFTVFATWLIYNAVVPTLVNGPVKPMGPGAAIGIVLLFFLLVNRRFTFRI